MGPEQDRDGSPDEAGTDQIDFDALFNPEPESKSFTQLHIDAGSLSSFTRKAEPAPSSAVEYFQLGTVHDPIRPTAEAIEESTRISQRFLQEPGSRESVLEAPIETKGNLLPEERFAPLRNGAGELVFWLEFSDPNTSETLVPSVPEAQERGAANRVDTALERHLRPIAERLPRSDSGDAVAGVKLTLRENGHAFDVALDHIFTRDALFKLTSEDVLEPGPLVENFLAVQREGDREGVCHSLLQREIEKFLEGQAEESLKTELGHMFQDEENELSKLKLRNEGNRSKRNSEERDKRFLSQAYLNDLKANGYGRIDAVQSAPRVINGSVSLLLRVPALPAASEVMKEPSRFRSVELMLSLSDGSAGTLDIKAVS